MLKVLSITPTVTLVPPSVITFEIDADSACRLAKAIDRNIAWANTDAAEELEALYTALDAASLGKSQ